MSSASSSFRLLALLSAGFLGGCASAAPASPRIPDPSTPREPDRLPAISTTRSAPVFTYREGQYAYDLLQTTTVTVGSEAGGLAEDTLRTIAGLTYSIIGGATAPVVSISVDSLMIASVRDTAMPIRRLAAPVVVVFPVTPIPFVTLEDTTALVSTCDAMEEAARALADDVHVEIPVAVPQGHSWSDSTSFVICRGGIPLTGTRVSRFLIAEVRDSRDTVVARVSRQTTLAVVGVGAQGSRRITVRGDGTSDTMFVFELTTGRFLGSTSQSVLRLGFETIQQTDQIIQRSSSTVRLRGAMPR